MPNFGGKSLELVAASIAKFGLKFDMEMESWPPLDLVNLRKKYEIKMNINAKNNIDWWLMQGE